jgi:nitrite reductase/ring-hydroxylating ferredoxin subunit
MVNHARPASGPRKWIPVVRERDLEQGQTRTVQVEEREILLYRSDGVISAIEGTCSHAGAPLGRGKVENGVVTCPGTVPGSTS